MKKFLVAFAACAVLISSCKKETEVVVEPTPPAYEFANQNLKGTIDGKSWELAGGYVMQYFDGSYYFAGFPSTTADYCTYYNETPNENHVNWFMDDLKVGLVEFNAEGSQQSANFSHGSNDVLDFAFFNSAIEIISIDTVAGEVKGRTVLKGEQTSSVVNGNFTFTLCK